MPFAAKALALGAAAAVTVTVKVREIAAKVGVAAWVAVIVAPAVRAIAGLLDV